MNGASPHPTCLFKQPSLQNELHYETAAVDPEYVYSAVISETENPSTVVPLYEILSFTDHSPPSSLIYQYVPSKVRVSLVNILFPTRKSCCIPQLRLINQNCMQTNLSMFLQRVRQQGVKPEHNFENHATFSELENVVSHWPIVQLNFSIANILCLYVQILCTIYIHPVCTVYMCTQPFLCILQCASDYIEPACEEVPFTEPAEEVGDIYDQLAHEKCIEIPISVLK